MDKIYRAKQIYTSIEIPPELNSIVASAIEKSKAPKNNRFSYIRVLAPCAACVAICVALASHGFFSDGGNSFGRIGKEAEAGISVASEMPGANVRGAKLAMEDTPYSTMVSSRVESEREKGNELVLIYLDENFASFCTSSAEDGTVRYSNFRQDTGEDVSLSELGIEGYPDNTQFYIRSAEKIVIVDNGTETELNIVGGRNED